jgi:hypothetical protein
MSEQLAELDQWQFEARQSDDCVKQDLELTCAACGEHLCDIEHGDSIASWVGVAAGHVPECSGAPEEPTCTDLPCPECSAPAGRPCEVWCIADQATPAGRIAWCNHDGPAPGSGICECGEPLACAHLAADAAEHAAHLAAEHAS